MLKQENKIFKTLYNDLGWEIDKAIRLETTGRDTKNMTSKRAETG